MASAITVAVRRDNSIDRNTVEYFVQLTVGAGTYTTGGLAFDLRPYVQAPGVPFEADIYSYANPNSGYFYTFAPGTDNSNGLLQIWNAGSEIAAGATPAGVTGDTIYATFRFSR